MANFKELGQQRMTKREFLRWAALTSLGLAVAACTPVVAAPPVEEAASKPEEPIPEPAPEQNPLLQEEGVLAPNLGYRVRVRVGDSGASEETCITDFPEKLQLAYENNGLTQGFPIIFMQLEDSELCFYEGRQSWDKKIERLRTVVSEECLGRVTIDAYPWEAIVEAKPVSQTSWQMVTRERLLVQECAGEPQPDPRWEIPAGSQIA